VISVNGKIITDLGTKVKLTDVVLMEGQKISQEKKVYILLNKPKDYITTADDPEDRKTVMNLIKDACRERLYPVGRLDRNTTGVLLMTNDGELTKKLTHPKYQQKKLYHVFLDKPLTKADFESIESGVELEDGFIKVDAIDYVAKSTTFDEVGLEIHSGRNRIVRRIFENLGYRVVKLDRVMFSGLTKKDLPRGRWRFLTPAEVSMLYAN
jgi:23S rRNA pseudouridine2605 synthase